MWRIYGLLIVACIATQSEAATVAGRVVGVSDGDTITVLDADKRRHRIRLAAIDAPERKRPFGAKSKQNLYDMVSGKDVAVDWKKRDRYKRVVGKVLVDETGAECAFRSCLKSFDVGLQQIRDGMAWHDMQYARDQSPEDRARYSAAESKARHRRVGLWVNPEVAPPANAKR